ncbi:unannotated protein [freshwater metagenome]|uniref:glutaminase n=1 Tax=freshwater metagenome TaxID=449393 RepID=A0A6J7ES53_9ZZZZ|nr:pyridoxal 5'-phosphate synthase glutaminase subunit PdxT [Actinomycetota bacterium]
MAGQQADGSLLVGVLALQGDFQAHKSVLEALGATVREVRTPAQLADLDALVLPGGESTTMTLGIEREGLAEPLRALRRSGVPILGTCAGLILADRDHLALMDMRAQRNAFGRQVHSFEADLDLGLDGGPVRAAFIRAPWITDPGPGVELLAQVDGHAVAAREGSVTVLSFHPEISGEHRLHARFLEEALQHRRDRGSAPSDRFS